MVDRIISELLVAPHTIRELSAASGVPETVVREVVSQCRSWVEVRRGSIRLDDSTAQELRNQLAEVTKPLDISSLSDYVESLSIKKPRPRRDADHVAATNTTLIRRVQFLHDNYALNGRTILFLGDHDLTSLAFAYACPTAQTYVVDFDEDVLDVIATETSSQGTSIRTRASDLRLGAPRSLLSSADLVFSDPPYAILGMRLFLSRSLELLSRTAIPRVVMAFGYSLRALDRALAFQQLVQDHRMVLECVTPAFNTYDGAEVLGSRSSLYALMPSASTRASRQLTQTSSRIYTGGRFSATNSASAAPTAVTEECVSLLRTNRTKGTITIIGDGLSIPKLPETVDVRQSPWSDFRNRATASSEDFSGIIVRLLPPNTNLVRWAMWLKSPAVVVLRKDESQAIGELLTRATPIGRLILSAISAQLSDVPAFPEWQSLLLVPRSVGYPRDQILQRVMRHSGKLRKGVKEAIIHCHPEISQREARSLMASHSLAEEVLDAFLDELPLKQLTHLVQALEAIDTEIGNRDYSTNRPNT